MGVTRAANVIALHGTVRLAAHLTTLQGLPIESTVLSGCFV